MSELSIVMVEAEESVGESKEVIAISKYQAKQQRKAEKIRNAKKIQGLKPVNEGDIERHNKVSKRLYLSRSAEAVAVVCNKTGIVCRMEVPAPISNVVLQYESPFSLLSNARGFVQQGYGYLQLCDTQIVAGLFLTLAEEYNLLRYKPSATGAENNAILRTAGKDKLIEACLLIELRVHSGNCNYLPALSLIYEHDLKDLGCEGRLTEWMKIVNEAIDDPDIEEYDENALLDKPMKGIKELKKEYTAFKKEQKRVTSLKDKNYKERAAFRKDMKEAKGLIKALKGTASDKMVAFLSSLFTEESYLTVDVLLLGQVITKLEPLNTVSSNRLIEILKIDRRALRLESAIDELDDPLMQHVEAEMSDPENEEEDTEEDQDNWTEGTSAFDAFVSSAEGSAKDSVGDKEQAEQDKAIEESKMPAGLTKIQQILWRKKHGS